jgi:hypothetical protein
VRMEGVILLDTRDAFVNAVDYAASMRSRAVLLGLKILSVAYEMGCDSEERGRS